MTESSTPAVAVLKRVVATAVILCAVATPALAAYAGVELLATELAGRQPDGDLEAGGGFALAVLLVELVAVGYLVSAGAVLVLWRWIAGRPLAILATVALASLVVVLAGVVLAWR